jgi:hypothetical protein
LMENVKAWPDIWQRSNFHGATLGTSLNVGDPRLPPRLLMVVGLALTTTAAWSLVDAGWFGRREVASYHAWIKSFAWRLYALGAGWFAIAGSWYCLMWTAEAKQAMFQTPWVVLTLATASAPGVVGGLILLAGQGEGLLSRGLASAVGLAQFALIGLNAASRQAVQHVEFAPYFDVAKQPVDPQWSPMLIFLVTFALGLGLIAWIIRQVAELPPVQTASNPPELATQDLSKSASRGVD